MNFDEAVKAVKKSRSSTMKIDLAGVVVDKAQEVKIKVDARGRELICFKMVDISGFSAFELDSDTWDSSWSLVDTTPVGSEMPNIAIASDMFPHTCPLCGRKSFNGLSTTDCSNRLCDNG